jgi:hypothetical protein
MDDTIIIALILIDQSGAQDGWSDPVRRSSASEDGSDTHQARFTETMGFAKGSTHRSDLPGGRPSQIPVHPFGKKYFASPFAKISIIDSAVPPRAEGRFAVVTNVGAGCDGRGGGA